MDVHPYWSRAPSIPLCVSKDLGAPAGQSRPKKSTAAKSKPKAAAVKAKTKKPTPKVKSKAKAKAKSKSAGGKTAKAKAVVKKNSKKKEKEPEPVKEKEHEGEEEEPTDDDEEVEEEVPVIMKRPAAKPKKVAAKAPEATPREVPMEEEPLRQKKPPIQCPQFDGLIGSPPGEGAPGVAKDEQSVVAPSVAEPAAGLPGAPAAAPPLKRMRTEGGDTLWSPACKFG